jgi:coatomer subunit beta
MVEEKQSADESQAQGTAPPKLNPAPQRRVLADGTYAMETAFSVTSPTRSKYPGGKERPPLRSMILVFICNEKGLIMHGDYFLGAVLATAMTKMILRLADTGKDVARVNSLRAEAMLIMTSVIRVGQSEFVTVAIEEDSVDRILLCLRVLGSADPLMKDVFVKHCHDVYARIVQAGDVRVAYNNDLIGVDQEGGEGSAKQKE